MTTAPTQATSRPAPPPARTGPPNVASAPVARKLDLTPRTATPIAPIIVVNAVEGFGKTTLGASAPAPVILMARGEKGYLTLLSAGRAQAVPAIDCETWGDLMTSLDALIADHADRKTVVLDALGGFERLCHEFICARDYSGDWGDSGFGSYAKGYDVSVTEWLRMLGKLEVLNKAGMTILVLSHAKPKKHKDPMAPEFDRWSVDVHEKTWSATARWADAILFGRFNTITDGDGRKKPVRGIAGADRVIYTEGRDAYVAKNRYGMQPRIDLSSEPAEMWPTIWRHITGTAE